MGVRALPQHLTVTGALALALCLLALLAIGSKEAHALEEGTYRPGELVVRLDPGVTIEMFLVEHPSLRRLDEDLPYNLEPENIYLLKAPDGTDLEQFAQDLLSNEPLVDGIAEPNYVAGAPEYPEYVDPTGVARMRARNVNDRKRHSKANKTFAEKLNLSTCERDIKGATVAVLDTGAQLDHPALRGNFRRVKRYDFVDNDPKPSDSRVGLNVDGNDFKDQMWGHGTHVAGIVDQVAPRAKIMPLRVLDSEGYGDVYDIARAIAFARGHGADVINLSLGASKHSKLLEEMVAETTSPAEYNIVVAAAAGNLGKKDAHYPAAGAYEDPENPLLELPTEPPKEGLLAVISVKTPKDSWKKSGFANYGYWVGIAAPGEDIRSAFPRDKYATWSGTSMATPFISGQAALIRTVNDPTITSEDIEDKVRIEARPIKTDNQEYELPLSIGHANVCNSL